MANVKAIDIDNSKVHLSVIDFNDTYFVVISDTGTFGSFYKIEKSVKAESIPIININSLFGEKMDYIQVYN